MQGMAIDAEDLFTCPRCGGDLFDEFDCSGKVPENPEEEMYFESLASMKCAGCGLWWHGWESRWVTDCSSCEEEAAAPEFVS